MNNSPDAVPQIGHRVTLSGIETEALARMESAFRSACASIIVSRGGDESARWSPVRGDQGQIVAFEMAAEEPAPEKGP